MKANKTIGIVAPSYNLGFIDPKLVSLGIKQLSSLGCNVKIGKNVFSTIHNSAVAGAPSKRIEDIRAFLLDEEIDILMSVIGGYGSIQLLDELDYNLIERAGKSFIGFSDTTTLLNAIYAKTSVNVFIGPAFVSFCNPWIPKETIDCFSRIVLNECSHYNYIQPANIYCDDWFLCPEKNRKTIHNKGYTFVKEGRATGPIVGGNLPSFLRLIGTQFMPKVDGCILLIEGISGEKSDVFVDQLYQLKIAGILNKINGLIIGQFGESHTFFDVDLISQYVSEVLSGMSYPVVVNASFSHVDPIYTIKLGASITLDSVSNKIEINM